MRMNVRLYHDGFLQLSFIVRASFGDFVLCNFFLKSNENFIIPFYARLKELCDDIVFYFFYFYSLTFFGDVHNCLLIENNVNIMGC